MQFFPLFHRLENCRCLFVGGGAVALRKAKILQHSGIIIDVFSPEIIVELEELSIFSKGQILKDHFSSQLIKQNYTYIIAATDCKKTNLQVANFAKTNHIPVNVVDSQSHCDFIFPAIVDRNPLTIAISNSGSSPVLSKLLKQQINQFVPNAYGDLSNFFGQHRVKVNTFITDKNTRIAFWQKVLQGAIAETIFSGNHQQAETMLTEALENPQNFNQKGEVYLIGVGSGDADLLTLRAFRLLQQADVVLYDGLISEQVMMLIDANTKKINVGKKRNNHSVKQSDIHQLLVKYVRQGKRVARLKGGDSFVFEYSIEEIEKLIDNDIPFQVVPGVIATNI